MRRKIKAPELYQCIIHFDSLIPLSLWYSGKRRNTNLLHTFDPVEKAREIQQLLVSDKKKIGFLFGAGTSMSKKDETSPTVPAVTEMTSRIVSKLVEKPEWKNALDSIKEDFSNDGKEFNIETLLSNVEEKMAVIGKGQPNGLDIKDLVEFGEQTWII